VRLLTKLVRALACRSRREPDAQTTWTQRLVGGKKAYRKGDYAKAEERFVAAFKRTDVNGSLNHRAAAALNNLGIVYKRQRKFKHAEIALRRALRAYTVMEPQGPCIASVLWNLAALYQAQRRYADAAPLYKQAIAMTEKALGLKHPKLAKRLERYARLLEKMNDPIRARQLQARAQAIRAGH
jgi:tetratricopeptide (TPR) repeat protein